VAAPPAYATRFVESVKRKVDIYVLDNEPALWNSTHRDVHPEPVTYDELLDKTIQYGAAIRKADPDAKIAGPAEWGWPGYSFSAKDAKEGFHKKPDRLAHGDVALTAWYLQKLKEHESKTGVRILDLLDLHFYPQADAVFSDAADPKVAALRLRQTRGLWDPRYEDESWIKEPVRLIPRMREWIDQNYPGRGIMVGEWNFGGEGHISGGLAVAEALGRFAENEVAAAFYWTAPPDASPAYWGFRAYRNFDDHGGHFLENAIATRAPEDVSLFASRDDGGKHVVLVALNLAADKPFDAAIDVASCGAVAEAKAYTYAGGPAGFSSGAAPKTDGKIVREALAPHSITVVDLTLAK
jgi:hypothetical protein